MSSILCKMMESSSGVTSWTIWLKKHLMLEAILLFKTAGLMTPQLCKKPWTNCWGPNAESLLWSRELNCRYFLSIRAPKVWNQLPDEVLSSASLDCFKAGQDKIWASQHFDIFKLTWVKWTRPKIWSTKAWAWQLEYRKLSFLYPICLHPQNFN